MRDYAKLQEINNLLFTFVDEQVILKYCFVNQWVKNTPYMNNYIIDLNRIYIDLIYGKKNRLLNEFDYQYIEIQKDELIPFLQHLVSEIQIIQTVEKVYTNIPLGEEEQTEKSQTKSPEKPSTKPLEKIIITDNSFVINRFDKTYQQDSIDVKQQLQQIYKNYQSQQDEKSQRTINYHLRQLDKYNKGLIQKIDLIKELHLKNGIYYKDNTAVLQQCQVEKQLCETDQDQNGNEMQIQTQIYVSKILYDYLKILEDKLFVSGQVRMIKDVQLLSDSNIKQYIVNNDQGAMDYYIRLTILALYRHMTDKYDLVFNIEIYQQMLLLTDQQTLKFRQEKGVQQEIDFSEIVDAWWGELQRQGKFQEQNEESEEGSSQQEIEVLVSKQTKTMGE